MHLTYILPLKFKRVDFLILAWQCLSPYCPCLLSKQFCLFLLQFHTRHFQQWAIPVKTQTWAGGLSTWNFQGYWRKSIWKFQGSAKKELVFPQVLEKTSCGISMGFGFWPWNFQGMSHNFSEFSGVKACFLWNF